MDKRSTNNSLAPYRDLGKIVVLVALGLVCPHQFRTAPASAQELSTKNESTPQERILDVATKRLFDSIERNDLAAVRNAVAAGADITARNGKGVSPGDRAVALKHFEIVRYLLSLADGTAPGESIPAASGAAPTGNRELFRRATPAGSQSAARKDNQDGEGILETVPPPPRNLGVFKWIVKKVNRPREPSIQIAEADPNDNPHAADIYSDVPNGPQPLTSAATLGEETSRWDAGPQDDFAGRESVSRLSPEDKRALAFSKPDPPEDFRVIEEFDDKGRPDDAVVDRSDDPVDTDADLANVTGDGGKTALDLFGDVLNGGNGDAVQEAMAPPKKIDPIQAPTGHALEGVELTLSAKMKLEQPLLLSDNHNGYKYRCIDKKDALTVFCVEPVNWPGKIARYMEATSVMYAGEKIIVRYDGAMSSHIHILFPTAVFDLVAAYYQKKFGPPTEAFAPIIAPFAQQRQTNPRVIWRSAATAAHPGLVLEIRKFDDLRNAFPDLKRGAVMLYSENSPGIFDFVSPLDFMLGKQNDLGRSKRSFRAMAGVPRH